ncbi:MAG: alcohol dehydrogenase catalytic domain-containing protein [Bdellovibrionales bacterium]|nr:alcohol dehydrogenase catalytic domain-containing protein [Bdellovibrionales bacterium]
MRAQLLHNLASITDNPEPLRLEDIEQPVPGPGEILLRVSVCGVCHTELDEIEGRTPPPRLPVVPGHQVVGTVVELGTGTTRFGLGDRLGVGWIHHSDGTKQENIAPDFCATGRDVNGGYADFMTVPEAYAVPIPEGYSDIAAAPLLCAGAVGYRAFKLCNLVDGQPLGLAGFGGSNHLVLQMARYQCPNSPVYVFARDESERAFALQLGAAWAGSFSEECPRRCGAILDTTPAWRPVVSALGCLAPGGRLVINAIRKTDVDKDALLEISYHEHLWMEREIKSVANVTRFDLEEFLPFAAKVGLCPEVQTYPLEEANRALVDLSRGGVRGAKVLLIGVTENVVT